MVHRVQRGETLWSVARRYGVSVDALVRENRISDITQVKVGQRLMIPSGRNLPGPSRRGAEPPARQPPVAISAGEPFRSGPSEEFAWPVQGKVIAIFGTRWRGRVNKGIDVQARAGTEVRATRSGKVSFVHEGLPGFGKTIILEHAEGFASVYAYVGEILVRQDEWVNQRQVIARVGETGRTQVPALHFEIRRNQKAQNPLHYLP
ncbi:MAG: M23 family metallopeptidase [Candidatus Omnitrophota bacterium]|nr:M23 family metallopeptidase [Candidatus Omnitrophota bacterium]